MCAKAIRQELKKEFPTIKFSVTSETFSMGNAVNISYLDGVTSDKVSAVVKKYEDGYFDGMTDTYHIVKSDLPTAKFVTVSRSISKERQAEAAQAIAQERGIKDAQDESEWMRAFGEYKDQVVWKETRKMSFL